MGKHNPDRVQWNKVLKIIRKEFEYEDRDTISLRDIAKALGLREEPLDAELKKTLSQLTTQGRISIMLGQDRKKMVCLVAKEIKPRYPSKREIVGMDDAET